MNGLKKTKIITMKKVKSAVTEKDTTKKDLEFPRLMKASNPDNIVLMTEYGKGVVLFSSIEYEIGYLSSIWNMDIFSDFDGEITLKNE